MDENIIIAAYHEAGHALMAYIMGWSIYSANLNVSNDVVLQGITNYNFGEDLNIANESNIKRRLSCSLGGPISEGMHRYNNPYFTLDPNALGHDGEIIEICLQYFDPATRNVILDNFIGITANFLRMNPHRNAVSQIADILIGEHEITEEAFLAIVTDCDVRRLNFNI